MRRTQCFKIKTINLDPDLFIQDNSPNHKLTPPLIRTLTQRRERIKTRSTGQNLQKRAKSYLQSSEGLQEGERRSLNFRGKSDSPLGIVSNQQPIKEHLKTNPNMTLLTTSKRRINRFERYNHLHSFAAINRPQDPEATNDLLMKEFPLHHLTMERESERKENFTELNPYTKNQYIYLRNKQIDQINQVQRSIKINRMSSIIQSYRIATISLTPQHSRRGNSLQTVAATPQLQKVYKPQSKQQKGQLRESQIKPWDALAFESREFFG